MHEPSIKGVILYGVVESLRDLRDRGFVNDEELEAKLEKADLELIAGKLNQAQWYPVETFSRLSEVALALEPGTREQACIDSGARDARRMIQGGLYQQLEALEDLGELGRQSDSEERFRAFGQQLRMSMSLTKGLYNFSDWQVILDPDDDRRYCVKVSDASRLPDIIVIGTVGFLNECARHASPDNPTEWSVERPSRDTVVYKMSRSYL